MDEEKQQKQAEKLLKVDERKRSYPLLYILIHSRYENSTKTKLKQQGLC